MATLLRSIGAIFAALLVAFLMVMGVELFSSVVHPLPEDFTGSMEEMCQHVANYPDWVLAVAAALWTGIALASTWIAGRLGNRASALFVGLVLLAMLILNISMLPYPIWFKVANLVALPSAALAGAYLSSRPAAAVETPPTSNATNT